MAGEPECGTECLGHVVKVRWVGIGVCLVEVQVPHVVKGHHVQVGVRYLEPGDHEADAIRGE